MKFLIKYHYLDSYFTQPPEKIAPLSAANMAYAEETMKSGKVKDAYLASDMKHMIMIVDVASSEETARLTVGQPAFPYTVVDEVTPLVEFEVAAKAWKESLQKALKK
jgi:hypothetical protein